MSGLVTNPFSADTEENPFDDPSVTQVTHSSVTSVDHFNPFPNETLGSTAPYEPAVLQPSTEPGPKQVAAAAQAELLKRQEELEKKAAKLEKREEDINNRPSSAPGGKENNWPPLPKSFPIQPCFYQDFSEEIPAQHQRVVKMLYYLWMMGVVSLFLNVLSNLARFTTNPLYGVDFGFALLWFLLFSPCSFLCWFRPVYRAFRTDSSFSFFFFFFVFFCQIVVFIIQAVGVPGWGNSGWIVSFSEIGSNKAVAGMMMMVAILFTMCSVLSIFLLKLVHKSYRGTGASFVKAQQEFSQGVFINRTFRTAASSAAQTALSQEN